MNRAILMLVLGITGFAGLAQNFGQLTDQSFLARTVTAAAGGGWTPTNETVVGWWDSTLITNATDTRLTVWYPRTGANLIGPNNAQPKYHAAVQNGLGIVRFEDDSVAPGRLEATNQNNNLKPMTVALVIKVTGVTNIGFIMSGNINGAMEISYNKTAETLQLRDQNQALIGDNLFPTNVWMAAVITYSGTGGYAFHTNGVAGESGTLDRAFSGGLLWMSTSGTQPLYADVGDVVYDDEVWSSATISNFFAWADSKWDLSY